MLAHRLENGLYELCEPYVAIVTYRSVEEAIEKAHYLLYHPDEMASIARAGQARTFSDHTVDSHASALVIILENANEYA